MQLAKCRIGKRFAQVAAVLSGGILSNSIAVAQTFVPSSASGWEIRLAPYLWAAGLEGRVAALSNLPTVDIDAGFSEILDNTDIALMVAAEFRNGKFGVLLDLNYLSLSTDAETRGPLFGRAELESRSFFGDLEGAYRIYDIKPLSVDVMSGIRFWRVETELTLTPGLLAGARGDTTESWVDPIIGLRTIVDLGHGFSLSGLADVGGFGISSDVTWQVMGFLRYEVSDWLDLVAGYRHLDVDFEDGGFVWDVALSCPILGATFRF